MSKPTNPDMTPFAESASSLVLGGLTIENGAERVALYGNLDLTRDAAGLALARQLKSILDAAVTTLEADPVLPAAAPGAKAAGRVRNPFG